MLLDPSSFTSNNNYNNFDDIVISNKDDRYSSYYGTTIKCLLAYLVQRQTFLSIHIKRYIHSYLRTKLPSGTFPTRHSTKPSGLLVSEMFDSKLFQSGSCRLHSTSHNFRVDRLCYYHCLACPCCKVLQVLHPTCYFNAMLRCITHGWRPPFLTSIVPQYSVQGNYSSISLYQTSVDLELQDMINRGVLIPHQPRDTTILSPLGAVLKNSDRMRARTLVHTVIHDQASLTIASDALLAIHQPKIKCRVTTDSTASGLNAACYAPSFQYPSLSDAIHIITPECFMAIGDITRFFHSFPLALDDRHLYAVAYGGKIWIYARCWFGFSACPYYCSTWSAEFRQMLAALGITTAHMMDDWIIVGKSLQEAIAIMLRLTQFFEDIGLEMAFEKYKYGQILVYLGVLIDTVKMTIRFESVQAQGMRSQLNTYLNQIMVGDHLDHTTIRHVCGKLNWYSEVVQSGRIHIRSWWRYERHGKQLSKPSLLLLIEDTRWWISLLESWEINKDDELSTYPILSATILQNDPTSVYCIQSDASGPDGFGYFFSHIKDHDPIYISHIWDPPLVGSEQYNSHAFELKALCHYLTKECNISSKILVWISDSESAVYSVNKGVCKDPIGFNILKQILHQCDILKISLMAVWTPREENQIADYLSHLANNLNVISTRGWLSDFKQSV